MLCGRSDDLEFLARITSRRAASRGAERLADPFRYGHSLSASETLNLAQLGLLEKDLKSLTHIMSLFDSLK